VPLTLVVGLGLCLVPATPVFPVLLNAYQRSALLRGAVALLIFGVWVLAVGRALAIPFKPFIYFRF
jgi:alginate O-acetyltransferase complex protein AlgI